MSVIVEIAKERERQAGGEGFTDAHDDEHGNGELARAASCYCLSAAACINSTEGWKRWRATILGLIDDLWPWSRKWWKPKDARRDLIRAAALIVAEIERLDRQPEYDAKRFAWTYTGDGRSAG